MAILSALFEVNFPDPAYWRFIYVLQFGSAVINVTVLQQFLPTHPSVLLYSDAVVKVVLLENYCAKKDVAAVGTKL